MEMVKCNKCEFAGIMVMCDCCPKGKYRIEVPKGMKIKEEDVLHTHCVKAVYTKQIACM